MKIGIGFDVHAFAADRKLVLGGLTIPYHQGLDGHSDADVVIHAIMDALLGAAGLGDIGTHFPDDDPVYKNADSMKLLKNVHSFISRDALEVSNMDIVIMAQQPKLAPYIAEMKDSIAQALNISNTAVNVKATTTEKLGFVGREEGIAAQVVVLLMTKRED
ncbi:2-C-methyl-D-erythritol 2,4-cyclodiphosphate synthase [Tindallia californiensis]|uniref:2-C-methyl-D-erythritol 2,4-cyclodiphosphate synthase n=1 Tax=Tindallia californiensis TaxID=159292 RepID=A0A1H3R9R7_9FIRM|nr:2-C-methyl-D-erythritol 2,4-cyclodiphosphate synthase [Tindallia californiensis]SDZ22065.1 2-C-methyl-D-erythritol 2,4-cyclodiphosphate synthase [Tindallia californiensis]